MAMAPSEKGQPVLKNRLKGFLERQEGLLEFVAGEAADGNPGHTIVTPLKRLPEKTMFWLKQSAITVIAPRRSKRFTDSSGATATLW